MKSPLVARAAPWLIGTVLLAAPVWAQQASAPAGTGGSAAASAPSGTTEKAAPRASARATARQPGESVEALVERRIADLHSRLHISPEQQQQWDQFAQVMRDNAKQMDALYQERAQKFTTMSAVDNMQNFAQIDQQRAQDMQKLVPAFQTLYASLSDQQKKTADQMFRNYTASTQSHRQASAR